MRALLTAAAVLALAASASAETLKVPQQYDTIQEAVDNAAPGDTVLVSKGVYYEQVYVSTPGIKLVGRKAVLDGSFFGAGLTVEAAPVYTCLLIYADGVTVQGFTFRNGLDHVVIQASDCSVLKCVSRNAAGFGVYVGGYSGSTISGNRVLGPGGVGIYVSGSSAGSGLVASNAIRQGNGTGIRVEGFGAAVDRNTVDGVNSIGVSVNGSDAVVTGNRTTDTASTGIQVEGIGADVIGNRATWIAGNTGIYVNGNGSLVEGNTVNVAYDDFEVYGTDNQVLGNRALGALGGAGFYIGGDNITVTGNLAQHVVEYGSGFYIYSYSAAGGSLIAANRAEDASYAGFYLSVNGMGVYDCVAVRCGDRGGYAGFFVSGSGNPSSVEDCVAEDGHGNGFHVNGNGMVFNRCSAKNPTINGFLVYGANHRFYNCSATGSGGQGFNNQGLFTILDGGTYKGNRVDITNDGSFNGTLDGVEFETGGAGTGEVVVYYE